MDQFSLSTVSSYFTALPNYSIEMIDDGLSRAGVPRKAYYEQKYGEDAMKQTSAQMLKVFDGEGINALLGASVNMIPFPFAWLIRLCVGILFVVCVYVLVQ